MSEVRIERGSLLIYRFFDVAEEIDLAAIERLLKERNLLTRLRIARSTRQAFHIRNAPVLLALGATTLRAGTRALEVETFAKVWDYGILSLQFRLPIEPGTPWSELIRLAAACEDESDIDEAARRHARSLTQTLASAMKLPHEWEGIEDYAIFFFEKLAGVDKPAELLQAADVPALILADPVTKLAPRVRGGILETLLQYGESDLAIIDWNAAVVVEPSGQRDVADVLEFAVTHLMEFRYYDDLLDQRLTTLYDAIEQGRGGMLRNSFGRLSHEASSRFIEFSEFIERVENSLKVVGDFYLATVFRTAASRFRLKDWEESITRKMNLLARVTELLQGEVNVQRSHWLEIIVIALIAFEIVSALIQL
jgi:hypothetical protein